MKSWTLCHSHTLTCLYTWPWIIIIDTFCLSLLRHEFLMPALACAEFRQAVLHKLNTTCWDVGFPFLLFHSCLTLYLITPQNSISHDSITLAAHSTLCHASWERAKATFLFLSCFFPINRQLWWQRVHFSERLGERWRRGLGDGGLLEVSPWAPVSHPSISLLVCSSHP